MNQELTAIELNSKKMLFEIKYTQEICEALLQSEHYKRLGREGVFAIVEKAKSIGVDPLDALNGGMYYVQGKVEMTSSLMNQLIRQNKHNITKDKRSDDTICILHGKRADNGDVWSESFSINDAKLAGIYRNQWLRYPRDMLFARALSRLARQLFPDVIKGCYIQGEISDSVITDLEMKKEEKMRQHMKEEAISKPPEKITEEQYQELEDWISDNLSLRQNILNFMKKKWGIESLQEMPVEIYEHALNRAKQQFKTEEVSGEQMQLGA